VSRGREKDMGCIDWRFLRRGHIGLDPTTFLVDIGRRETEEKRRRHPLFEARVFGKGDIGLDLTAFRCLAPRSRAEEKT
jgi:hypothetical protein